MLLFIFRLLIELLLPSSHRASSAEDEVWPSPLIAIRGERPHTSQSRNRSLTEYYCLVPDQTGKGDIWRLYSGWDTAIEEGPSNHHLWASGKPAFIFEKPIPYDNAALKEGIRKVQRGHYVNPINN